MIPGSANPLLLASAAGAAPSYSIDRSLRFNSSDSAYCGRTVSSANTSNTTSTLSWWCKRTKLGALSCLFSGYDGSSPYATYIQFDAGDTFTVTNPGYNVALTTSQVFRDPSAWYHFVLVWDTTNATSSNRYRLFVNGVRVTAFSTAVYPSQNDTGRFIYANSNNRIGTTWGSSGYSYCDAYLADVHLVDGQALDPTSFGFFDTNGIWQPKEYTGTYGTNGFHLDFADNSTAAALGTDTSGNGNDWTTHNLSISEYEGPSYINSSTWTLGGPSSSGRSVIQQPNLFDGNTSTFPSWSGFDVGFNESNWLQWNASGNPIPIPAGATVEIAGGATGTTVINGQTILFTRTITVNGTNFQTPNDNPSVVKWVDVTSAATTELQSIRWTEYVQPYGPVAWAPNPPRGPLAIRINGSLLLSPLFSARNDSLVDVPTNGTETDTGLGGEVRGNYATLNPLDKAGGENFTLSNGNLDGLYTNTGTTAIIVGTQFISSGKWFAEFSISAVGNNNATRIGIQKNTLPRTYLGGDVDSFAYVSNGDKQNNTVRVAYGASYGSGDVIGVALDLDAGTLAFYKNGVSQGQAYSGLSGEFAFGHSAFGNGAFSANFGQRPFAFSAPSGFKALCTAKLPSTTITTSGSYTGNGVADGPFVFLNGVPTAMTVNGNAVTFGANADKLSNGFKIRTTSTTFNQNASTYNYSITTTGAPFKTARAQSN